MEKVFFRVEYYKGFSLEQSYDSEDGFDDTLKTVLNRINAPDQFGLFTSVKILRIEVMECLQVGAAITSTYSKGDA